MPTVLVTGANRGLGLEFVRKYGAAGWQVLACCRHLSAELCQAPNTTMHEPDVTDHAGIESLAAKLSGRTIDVLINNAGVNG